MEPPQRWDSRLVPWENSAQDVSYLIRVIIGDRMISSGQSPSGYCHFVWSTWLILMNLISIVLKPKTKTVCWESICKLHSPNDTNIGQIFLTCSLRVKFIYPRTIREQRSHMFPVLSCGHTSVSSHSLGHGWITGIVNTQRNHNFCSWFNLKITNEKIWR